MTDTSTNKPCLVLTNFPNTEEAKKVARHLIQHRLAACANVMSPCISVYTWQNNTVQENEIPLLIKTCTAQYDKVEQAILQLHPYELPEIIQVPISQGYTSYLDWVLQLTK